MASNYSEDLLVEQPTIALLEELGWFYLNCYEESYGASPTLGRETSSEVVLRPKLLTSLKSLNPSLPACSLDLAIEELTRDRSLMTPVQANREIYFLLKNGGQSRIGSLTAEWEHFAEWKKTTEKVEAGKAGS